MLAQNVGNPVGADAGVMTSDEEMGVLDFSKCLSPVITPQERHETFEGGCVGHRQNSGRKDGGRDSSIRRLAQQPKRCDRAE